jgi:hypothetical protein
MGVSSVFRTSGGLDDTLIPILKVQIYYGNFHL